MPDFQRVCNNGEKCKVCSSLLVEDENNKEHVERSTKVILGLLSHYSDSLLHVMKRGGVTNTVVQQPVEMKQVTETRENAALMQSPNDHANDTDDGTDKKKKQGTAVNWTLIIVITVGCITALGVGIAIMANGGGGSGGSGGK